MIELEPLKIAELIGPLVAFVVGIRQIGMIGWGIAQMQRASEHRDHQHEEAMTALRALIERTAPKCRE